MLEHQCVRSRDLMELERAKGFEPSTPTLARLCSTPELRPLRYCYNYYNKTKQAIIQIKFLIISSTVIDI